jgi:ABC-type glycerol-3-phosphate transport system substrate-binding protein
MNRRIIVSLSLLALLGLLSACGGNGGGSTKSASPRQVQVTLTDSTIQPSVKTFEVGIPYTFVVTNKGHSPHDFLIRRKVQGPATGPQGASGILFHSNKPVPPGATERYSFEFPLSSPQSQLQFASQLTGPNGHAITMPVKVKPKA